MLHRTYILVGLLLFVFSCTEKNHVGGNSNTAAPLVTSPITIDYPTAHYNESLDGRLILLIAQDITEAEPRFQLRDDAKTCQGFGMDVEGWTPGSSLSYDTQAYGYPINGLSLSLIHI